MRLRLILFVCVFLSIFQTFALATSYSWVGGSGTKAWNLNTNWSPVGVPSGAGDDVTFPSLIASLTLTSIPPAGIGKFANLRGNPVHIQAGQTLTLLGTGSSHDGVSSTIIDAGATMVIAAGANYYATSGPLQVDGTLRLVDDGALIGSAPTTNYSAGATLEYSGATNRTAALEFPASGTLPCNLLINKNTATNIVFPNNAVISGATTLNTGNINDMNVRNITFNGLSINNANARLISWAGGSVTLASGTNTMSAGEIWLAANLIVNAPLTVNGGQITLIGGTPGTISGSSNVSYSAAGSLVFASGWAGATTPQMFPPFPTPMLGTVDVGNNSVIIGSDVYFNGNFNTSPGSPHVAIQPPRRVIWGNSAVLNLTGGLLDAQVGSTMEMRRTTLQAAWFAGQQVGSLEINNPAAVVLTNSLTVRNTLAMTNTGNFTIGSNTLTINSGASPFFTGAGAGKIDPSNASSVILLQSNPGIDCNYFLTNTVTTLRSSAGCVASLSNNITVGNLDHQAGTISLSSGPPCAMTLSAAGTHTIAAAGTLNVGSAASLIMPNSTTLTNNGTLNVVANGTLEIQGNATFAGTSPSVAALGILLYTGAATKIVGAEWPATMAGKVIANKGAGNFLGLNAGARNQNGALDVQSGYVDVQVAGSLVLGGAVHTVQSGAILRVLDGGTISNLGNLSVNGGGTLSVTYNGGVAPVRTGIANFSSGAILDYSGNTLITTGGEFPNAMTGSVQIANTGGVLQQAGTTKTVAGTFSFVGSGTYSLNGGTGNGLVLNGPLVNTAGGSFQAFNNDLTINNTVTNPLRFGTVPANSTLNNFTIGASASNVQLGTFIIVGASGTLNLNGGNITTTAINSLTVNNTAPSAITRTSGYVDGPLIWSMAAAGAYNFPTGKGAQYLPFSISNPGGACTVSVEAFNANAGAAAGAGMGTPSTAEYWQTQSIAGAWTGGQVTLQPITAPSVGQVVGRFDGSMSPAGTYIGIGGNVAGPTIASTTLTPPIPATSMYFLRSTSLPLPTTATAITFTTVNTTDFTGGFTAAAGPPAGYLVIRRPAASAGTTPVNGTPYNLGAPIGSGTVIGLGGSTTFSTTGLVSNTSYAVDIYSYNGAGASIVYSASQLSGTVTTLSGAVPCTTGTITLPVTRYVLERNMQFTALSFSGPGVLSGAGTNTAYVNPGGMFQLNYTYNSTPAGSYCPGCVTQIYLGINGVFTHCIASHVPQTSGGSGMTAMIAAPATPGIYYVALNGSWDYVCYGSVGFSTNPVDAIATLIVGAPCQSNAGNMVQPAFAYPSPISYVSNTNGIVNVGNPAVWSLRVQDGGGAADADFLPTVITGMTINVTDVNNVLDRVALYDAAGTTKLGEFAAAPTLTFSGLDGPWGPFVTAPDNGSVDFILKATYKTAPIIDNSQFAFTVTAVTARTDRSGMGGFAVQGPSSTTGNNNKVDVVATRPSWTTTATVQPANVGLNPLQISPAPVVAGVDVNGNIDLGYIGTVQVSNPPSLFGGPINLNAVGGYATFTGPSAIRYITSGTMQLTATIGANTALSNPFTVQPAILSATPALLNFGNVAKGDFVEQSFTLNGSALPSNGLLQFSVANTNASISATGGGAFATAATIALNPTPVAPSSPGGSTIGQTIYVRYKPTTNSPMIAQLSATFPGSTSAAIDLQGQGMATTVTTSTLAMNFGSVFVGGNSDLPFSVSAKDISGPLVITASTGVTISSTGTAPFYTWFPLNPVSNQINPQLITARFTPTTPGMTVMGTITLTNPYTTATVISWQGTGANSVPVALGFASSAETSSTATGGVPGGVLDATPFTVQAASFRADGVIANVSTASVQLQVAPLPGGTGTFSLSGGAANFAAASRVTLPNVAITWTNAPLAGGVTQAVVTLVRTSGDVLQSTQAIISLNKGPVIPTITGISPLIIGSGSTVTISGTNFFSSTTVTFGGVPAAGFIINSANLITAIVGTSGASGDVEVRAPGGIARTRTASNSTDTVRFFGQPTIMDFNPKVGKAGDIVNIQGTNFDPSAIAYFGGIQAGSVTVNNPTVMNAALSANGDNGLVVVRTVGGTTTSSVSFSFVRPPDIQGLGTKFGTLGTEIIVTGANFKSISEVWLGPVQVTLSTVTVDSPQQLRFPVPAAVSGPIMVRNIAGTSISTDVFTFVFPPQITSMTPDSGSLGNQVIIRGQNFILVTSLTIAGATPLQTFVTSTTQIVAVLGRGETGTAPVIIQTIGGVTASTLRFTFINPPLVASIRPLVGGPRTMLTITGANFSAIDRVTVGGLDVRSYEVISTTQIVAVVSDAGGSGSVQVFNRLGGAFSSERFTFYFPPNVQNFDPLEGSTGSTITITGENFVNSTTTIVTIGGIPVAEFEVPMASQIIAVVSTGATGKVGVRTEGGYSESLMSFRFVPPRQVPPPRITTFAPDSASVGDIVTVDGLNFVNVRQVRVNGVTVASFTVNSPTSLNFLLPQVTSGTIEVQTTTGTATARRELVIIPPRVQLTPLQRDSVVAVQIYNATDGANWTRKRNWLTNVTIDRWQGVTVEGGRITQLTLDSAGLRGTLPIVTSNLTALKAFRVRGNSLEGAFPSGILLLPQLQELALSNNQFSGEIPSGIGSMTGLMSLRLDGNRFTGKIPAEMCSLIGLKEIVLAGNQLTGTIPSCFARIPVLERLDLGNNRFSGGIPAEFAALQLLQDLLVNNNFLVDQLPRTIWGSAAAAVAGGKNDGQVTATGLRSLLRLNISNNQIIGEIPTEIVNATSLQEFTASNNQLRGSLPNALGTLVNLRVLDVSNNSLIGQIPSSVRDLRLVERFAVSRNNLSGTIPLEIGQMVNLRVLALDSNSFSGAAPEALTTLARLQILRLQKNQITTIPNLSGITPLTILAVENNRLQFEVLEPNVRSSATSFTFTYSPQDSVGTARDTSAAVGLPFTLSSRLLSDNNVHTWFKNGREVPGVLSRALTFPAFARLDTGVYNARVTNSVVRGLTLFTRPVRVLASTAPAPSSPPTLLAPANQAASVSLNAAFEWLSVLGAGSYDVQIAPDAMFNTPILDSNVVGTQMRLSAGTLKSFTSYFWRVRARNESGVSEWSLSRTFTTIDAGALVVIPQSDIGRTVVGRTKSGTVEITSVSDAPVQIVGARLEGTDITAFRIDTSATSVRDVTIPAFGKYQIRINFNPASLGVKQVRLVLTLSNGGATTTERSGIVRGTPTFVDAGNLDFGTVLTNFLAVRNLEIANLGRDTIRIREKLLFSDTATTKLDPIAPQFPYIILPGETLRLPAQFQSSSLGETSGTISIITAQDTIIVNTKAFVRNVSAQDVQFNIGITTATISAAPGSRVLLKLYITPPETTGTLAQTFSNINRASNPSYSISISMNPNVLVPTASESKLIPQSTPGTYRITQPPLDNLKDTTTSTFLSFECIAVAGATSATGIIITERTWNSPNIFVGLSSTIASFTAKVSQAGGLRLIAPAKKTTNLITALKPNPSSDEAVIAYTMQQDEPLEIAVFDARGMKVRTLLTTSEQKSGAHTITLRTSDLASGQYRIMLIAPSGTVQEQLNVVR